MTDEELLAEARGLRAQTPERLAQALRLLERFEAFCSYHGLDVDTAFGCFAPPTQKPEAP